MSQFAAIFHRYGLFAMFLCILLEYGCFPVSSEIVLPLSGALASMESIPFSVTLPLSVLAGILGTSGCYLLGRIGGIPVLNRIMNRFKSTRKPIESSFETFHKYGVLAVGVGRVIPICRTYIAFVSGASKQPYHQFFIASIIGITVWNTLLIGLGYILKDNWTIVIDYYNQYKHIILLVIIVLLSLSLLKAVRSR